MWTDHAVSSDMLMKMEQHQKINHFPGTSANDEGMSNLSRKNLLARNLQKMQDEFSDDYDFFPKTWMLPYDYQKLRNYMSELRRQNITKTFIVKP
jgi:tubulin polyglutamylase TTLL6/13